MRTVGTLVHYCDKECCAAMRAPVQLSTELFVPPGTNKNFQDIFINEKIHNYTEIDENKVKFF